ncbi:hypothetical protein CN277_24440 [Bacillus cereus]|nr:hypothetical protein CN277_24440 [Bacillus cereus]
MFSSFSIIRYDFNYKFFHRLSPHILLYITKSHHRSDSFQGDGRKERKQMAKVSLRLRLIILDLLQATASTYYGYTPCVR